MHGAIWRLWTVVETVDRVVAVGGGGATGVELETAVLL